MKQIITYLVVTVLGLLSPSLSSLAQKGVFKEITFPEDFTEGYYVIVRKDASEILIGSNNEDKPRGKVLTTTSFPEGVKEVKDPDEQLIWKVEKNSSGQFTLRNMQSKQFLASHKDNELLESDKLENDKNNKSFTFGMYKDQGVTLQSGDLSLVFNKNRNMNVFAKRKTRHSFPASSN